MVQRCWPNVERLGVVPSIRPVLGRLTFFGVTFERSFQGRPHWQDQV